VAFPQKTAFSGIVNFKREIISRRKGISGESGAEHIFLCRLNFNTLIHTISPMRLFITESNLLNFSIFARSGFGKMTQRVSGDKEKKSTAPK